MISAEAYQDQARAHQEQLVVEQLPLVKRIALHLKGSLPAHIDTEDLIQAGTLGLLAASRDYSPDHGASFSTYAGIRIRGAILDEVRQISWSPRSVQKKAQMLSRAEREVNAKLGEEATDRDYAEALGVPVTEYHGMVQDVVAGNLLSLDEIDYDGAQPDQDPAEAVVEGSVRDAITDAIELLPEREQLFMSLYYKEELNLKEIGAVLGVSESRACQIHGQALKRIRANMTEWQEEG